MKLVTKTSLSLRSKKDLVNVFDWFQADLQMFLLCLLKLNLSLVWNPKIFTKEVDFVFAFPIFISVFVLLDLLLHIINS